MGIALGRDLRQMRDGEDLHVPAHLTDHRSHLVGHAAGYTGVDLVENHGRHFGKTSHQGLQAEHDTGALASRSAASHVNEVPARRREQE